MGDSGDRPVTIVTGGGRGIGAATTLELAREGHDLVVGYRADRQAAERTAARAVELGADCLVVRADVSDDGDVSALFSSALDRFGFVTGLVNNAGLTAHLGDLASTPVEVVERVIDVNFLGTVLCCRRAALVMSTRRSGRGGAIVNVSSSAATLGSPHEYVHYAAAKAAVDALTVGLSKELAPEGVRVNAVAPGLVRTGIHAGAGAPDRPDRVVSRIPLARPGDATEIAPAISWLLGPSASYVTGAILRIAGGL